MIGIMISITALVFGQFDMPRPNMNPFRPAGFTLLNPDQLSISHSMGFEASASSRGDAFYLSRYTNHIHYKFNPKLEMSVDLNFINYGSAVASNSLDFNDDNKSKVLPEFSLTYRPSDNVRINFRYEQLRSPEYYNRHWYRNW